MNPYANKMLLLGSSLVTCALLGTAAYQENVEQEWRRLQRQYRKQLPAEAAGNFKVQLRQIVVPALAVTDRCVSCHVGMASGESGVDGNRVFARHPRLPHDPADYGCTICHGGQGRATEKDAAHGDVHFWPEPMVPRRYAYAGCGTCHTHVAVPRADHLASGRLLVERADCLACHRLDGRGGTLRPGGAGGMEGPDLSRLGATGVPAAWFEQHTARRDTAQNPAWRASFKDLALAEREAITEYLGSRVGAPGLVEAKATFNSLGCRGCHKVHGVGGDDGPDLSRAGSTDPGQRGFSNVPPPHTLANWFAEHFRAPARVVAGSAMPELGLTETQIDSLTFYLLSLRESRVPEAYWPMDRIRALRLGAREFAADGATLYGTFCAACHGPRGQGMRYPGATAFPAIGNADFLALASDDFIRATVMHGRKGRRMPPWGESTGGLRPAEIDSVVAYVRRLGGTACEPDPRPRRWVTADAAAGSVLYAANCQRCHGARGEGAEGPALADATLLANASDTYLVETTRRGRRGTSMEGFATSSSVRRELGPGEVESIVAFMRTWEAHP